MLINIISTLANKEKVKLPHYHFIKIANSFYFLHLRFFPYFKNAWNQLKMILSQLCKYTSPEMEGIISIRLSLQIVASLLLGGFQNDLTIVLMSLSHYFVKTPCMLNLVYLQTAFVGLFAFTLSISFSFFLKFFPEVGAPFLEVLQYQVDAWNGWSKFLFHLLVPEIHLIHCPRIEHISIIKLIRTDTILDLSRKAEKQCVYVL